MADRSEILATAERSVLPRPMLQMRLFFQLLIHVYMQESSITNTSRTYTRVRASIWNPFIRRPVSLTVRKSEIPVHQWLLIADKREHIQFHCWISTSVNSSVITLRFGSADCTSFTYLVQHKEHASDISMQTLTLNTWSPTQLTRWYH